jgi:hypothetical protein
MFNPSAKSERFHQDSCAGSHGPGRWWSTRRTIGLVTYSASRSSDAPRNKMGMTQKRGKTNIGIYIYTSLYIIIYNYIYIYIYVFLYIYLIADKHGIYKPETSWKVQSWSLKYDKNATGESHLDSWCYVYQWIGLRENLQENIDIHRFSH